MNKNTFNTLLSLLVIFIITFITMSCLNVHDKSSDSNKNKKKANNTAQFADMVDSENAQSEIDTTSAANANAISKNETANSVKQAGTFKIEFGFNIGFLSDLQNDKDVFAKPLQQLLKDGINNLRIYEPFTKKIAQDPDVATNLIGNLIQSGFNVLLTLSNYPDVPSIQYKKDPEFANDQGEKFQFTNRYPPADVNAYESYLSSFLNKFQQKGLLEHMSFEIGNEPDSKRYFWGDTKDFVNIAKSTYSVLNNYNRPIYCCGFTSEFSNNAKPNTELTQLISDAGFMNKVKLSFHFYQSQKFDINKLKLPNMNNSIITEFNFFAYQTGASSDREAYANSPAFGSLLIQALVQAYKNHIDKIYFFKLVDMPGKEGTLGFFDTNGNPKPSYNYLVKIYDVIKDGYTLQETNKSIKLIGAQKTIVYTKTNENPTIRTFAQRSATKKINNFEEGSWSIANN